MDRQEIISNFLLKELEEGDKTPNELIKKINSANLRIGLVKIVDILPILEQLGNEIEFSWNKISKTLFQDTPINKILNKQ